MENGMAESFQKLRLIILSVPVVTSVVHWQEHFVTVISVSSFVDNAMVNTSIVCNQQTLQFKVVWKWIEVVVLISCF